MHMTLRILAALLVSVAAAAAGEHDIVCTWWAPDQHYQECGAASRTPTPDAACVYSDADKHAVAWDSMDGVPTRQPILTVFDTHTQKVKHVIGFMCRCDGAVIPEGTTHLCHD